MLNIGFSLSYLIDQFYKSENSWIDVQISELSWLNSHQKAELVYFSHLQQVHDCPCIKWVLQPQLLSEVREFLKLASFPHF